MPSEQGLEALFKGIGAGGIIVLAVALASVLEILRRLHMWREDVMTRACEQRAEAVTERLSELEERQNETDKHREGVREVLAVLKERGEVTARVLLRLEDSVTAVHRRLDQKGIPPSR